MPMNNIVDDLATYAYIIWTLLNVYATIILQPYAPIWFTELFVSTHVFIFISSFENTLPEHSKIDFVYIFPLKIKV